MKKSIAYASSFVALAIMLAMSLPASAATHKPPTGPGQNKLLCFDGPSEGTGFGGVCTLLSGGAKGKATLNNTDSNVNGDYAGVYFANSTMSGKLLSSITQLGYTYVGTTVPTPGDLSLNVPIDTNSDGRNDTYLFIDAVNCPGVGGVVNVITDPNCGIVVGSPQTAFYSNWAAMVAANPTWSVGLLGSVDTTIGTQPFIIAERTPSEPPAFWTVSNITLGKPGK